MRRLSDIDQTIVSAAHNGEKNIVGPLRQRDQTLKMLVSKAVLQDRAYRIFARVRLNLDA